MNLVLYKTVNNQMVLNVCIDSVFTWWHCQALEKTLHLTLYIVNLNMEGDKALAFDMPDNNQQQR